MLDRSGLTWGFNECLCLLVLFGVSVVALRLTTETLAPAMVRFPMPIYHAGRLVFGLAGACVTMAILILAFDTAPVHKKLFKAYDYDSQPALRRRIRPPLAGVLPARDRRRLRPVQQGEARPVPYLWPGTGPRSTSSIPRVNG